MTNFFLNLFTFNCTGQWGYCKICQNIQEDTNETKVSVQTPVTVRPSPSAEGNITGAYTRVSTIRLGDWLPDPDTVECYNNGIEESFFTMDGTKVDPGQIPFLVLIGYKVRVTMGA